MIGAMFYGLTGLKNHQTRIDVIGNNVANINTAGFKRARTTFKESFNKLISSGLASTETRGSINPKQIGYGSQLGSIDIIHTEGNIQITGNPTDLAIKGDGFFILKTSESVKGLTSGDYVYTRSGNFGIDPDGNLIYKPNGFKVQGWRTNSLGEIQYGQLMDISLKFDSEGRQILSTPRETTEISLGGNFNSQAGSVRLLDDGGTGLADEINLLENSTLDSDGIHRIEINGDQAILYSQDGIELSRVDIPAGANQIVFPEGLELSFDGEHSDGIAEIDILSRKRSTSIGIYDSKGTLHNLNFDFTKNIQDNSWTYEISTATVGDEIASGTISDIENFVGSDSISGTIAFHPSGTLESGSEDKFITINPTGGANLMRIAIDLREVTQFADQSDVSVINQNGIGPGRLESFQISPTGHIMGIYSNGVSQDIGQLALADVPNPGGLTRFQDTVFLESPSSGNVLPQQAGTFSLGSISAGALELSNVNLTDEFTDLIITERGFQANSRIITTSDEVLVEALNLKR